MYALGYDIGSSSVKAALVDLSSGNTVIVDHFPKSEMPMIALQTGWAEQDPELWWNAVCKVTQNLLAQSTIDVNDIKSIGISYQMHGLVAVDASQNVLRSSIIWCDSRAVDIGGQAFKDLGPEYCLEHLLNSPGNFTASKLKWVKDNEPQVFDQIDKIMLPGDYIAMKMTGIAVTTVSGLSEGMFWDFKTNRISKALLEYYGIPASIMPEITSTFEEQGRVDQKASIELGLPQGIPITYRAGDQPNNAMSLGVFQPGEVAATGGTSGVVYGVSESIKYDVQSRVNGFAHVNHSSSKPRIGQLLCINGAGSQYAWIRQQIANQGLGYQQMEAQLASIPIGSEGLQVFPFGNGAERMLANRQVGAHICNLQFNIHSRNHIYRAALEGIAFAFVYGMEILKNLDINPKIIKVGNDNLFQSATFANTIAALTGSEIQMIGTTGAIGAAKASGKGIGVFNSLDEAIPASTPLKTYSMIDENGRYLEMYLSWKKELNLKLRNHTKD